MPHQVLPASYSIGIAVGNDKKVVGNGGDGVVVVVGDDDAVVLNSFANHSLHVINVHRVNLCERLIQDVKRCVAMQYQVEFGQACLATGEFINGRIIMP